MENKSFGITVLATSLAFVLVQLDVSIVNVALATIGVRLRTGVAGLQWVVDGYAVAFAALLLSAGGLADRIGSRVMFMAGLGGFTAASVLCGLAPSAGGLIVARVLQGAAAAALVPSSLALLSQSCGDDAARRTWGVGMWTAAGSIGLAAGPVLGGAMVQLLGWRGIFLVNLPIGLAGLWLTWRFVAATPGAETRIVGTRTDWAGQVLAVLTLLVMTGSVIEAHRLGWASWPIAGGMLLAFLLLAAFVAAERRHAEPLLPLGCFAQRSFSGAIAVGFLLNMALYGSLFVLALYFQQTRHWSAWISGIAFLPLPVVLGLANLLGRRAASWLGTPMAMTAGLLLAACGMAALRGIGAATPYPANLPGLVLIGAGIGVSVPLMTAALLGSVPKPRAGVASGALNAVRQAGGAIGVALFGGLPTHDALLVGTALLVAASAAAAGLIRTAEPAQHPAGGKATAQPICR
ncbi:MFS transporter [Rhodopila sp.]|uniref:MFS transporter n=1 Tax=Rhodopila sp. TaxID=2480087 RepID=UPI003D10FDB3